MVVVLCNCPPGIADALARQVVDEGLAACVNVLPAVRSIYRWEGEVCVATEDTLLIKTARHRVGDLAERLRALHPYDVPEIVVLDVDVAASDARYVGWVRDATRVREGR